MRGQAAEEVVFVSREAACFDTLAIGRIEQNHALLLARRFALQRIATAELDESSHARAFGIALGKIDHAVSDIRAKYRDVFDSWRRQYCLSSFVFNSKPVGANKGAELLKTKTAQAARCNIGGDLRRFDRDGAAAAARVVEQDIGAPAAGREQGGGQGFFQRRVARVLAPAAFEERIARSVDVQNHFVLRQMRVQAHLRLVGVDIGPRAGVFAEAVDHGIFDFECGKVGALQAAVLAGQFNLEGLRILEPGMPRHRVGDGV